MFGLVLNVTKHGDSTAPGNLFQCSTTFTLMERSSFVCLNGVSMFGLVLNVSKHGDSTALDNLFQRSTTFTLTERSSFVCLNGVSCI